MLALATTLNIGWIVINWRTGVMLVLGILFFAILIAGVALNTIFLIREIKRNEQHDSFINAVTHELKTPVASIRLYLDTLKAREPDGPKRREFYDIMTADSDRLLATIEQVLEAGRVGSARKPAHSTRVDMSEIVNECASVARSRLHLGGDSIQAVLAPNSCVEGDPHDLKAAVSNLIDNAVKYSGTPVRVRAEVMHVDDKILVVVSDQGVGIPAEELKRIFGRFYRIPSNITQRVKGTGLGLFIVKSVARRHGGKVYAQSEGSGKGSRFTLELPGKA